MRGTSCRLSNLELGFFSTTTSPHQKYPCLTTRIKAAETRALLPIVSDLWTTKYGPTNAHHNRVHLMLTAIVDGYRCFDSDDYILPPRDQASLKVNFDNFFMHYRFSCCEAERHNLKRWHEVPTFHLSQHIVGQSMFSNPRWGWTYPDEDFESLLKAVCERSMAGTTTVHAVDKAVKRWVHCLALRAHLEAGVAV